MRHVRLAVMSALLLVVTGGVCYGEATLSRTFQDDTGGTAYVVTVGDGYAFVSNNAGISIYDVRNPEAPEFVTLYETPSGGVFDLAFVDTTLYAAAIRDGLLILDVSNPADPMLLGSYGRDVVNVSVHNGVAYVGQIGRNVERVDVSDPAHPVVLSQLAWGGDISVAGSDRIVFVTHPSRGIVTFDVTDPQNVMECGVVPGTASAYQIEVRGDELFVAHFGQGISVFSITDPRYPARLFSFPHTGEAYHASGEYPWVCVADLQEGVEVVDGSVPAAPVLVARDQTLAPHSVYYADGYVHVADQDEGYVLLRLTVQP